MVTAALREKMRAILRARNYSPRTEETYVAAVIHFARHFGTPPDQLGAEHVIAYQVWMRDQKCASHVLHNQTVCALRFFHGEVLDRPDVVERIRYARRERRLPVVLSVEETIALLGSIDHPRYRVLLTTIYATGPACRSRSGAAIAANDRRDAVTPGMKQPARPAGRSRAATASAKLDRAIAWRADHARVLRSTSHDGKRIPRRCVALFKPNSYRSAISSNCGRI